MKQSIIIHGPQGCGKTVNGQRLMHAFGLSSVCDASEGWTEPIPAGTLVLCNELPPAHVTRTGSARVLGFAEAMRLAGFQRSTAVGAHGR